MTTITSLITTLNSMIVNGVVTNLAYPPNNPQTADLPIKYVSSPQLTHNQEFSCDNLNDVWSISVIVLVEPAAQNLQPTNFEAMYEMMDNLNAGLKSINNANLGALITNWTILSQEEIPVIFDDSAFWAVIANITVRGT